MSGVGREVLRRESEVGVVVAANSDLDVNRGANREHGVSRRGHGGRGHQVSRKVVRQRRASGTKPKRGHNFDHRLRGERAAQLHAAETKVYDEGPTAIVARLIERFGVADALREDIEQEIWVRVLEGQTEAEVIAAMRGIKAAVADIELGPFRQMSLDAPVGKFADEGGFSLADMIDQDGRMMGRQAPLPWELRPTPESRDAVRQQRRAQNHLATELAKGERLVAREVERAARIQAQDHERERRRLERDWAREVEAAARSCVSLIVRSIARAERDHVRAELDAARVAFRAERKAIRALTFDWHKAHPHHGQKHREWWAANPDASQAMAEKNRRVWVDKGDEIAAKLAKSGKEWWDAHPEAKAQRGEAMRQAWVRRKAHQRAAA